MAKKSVDLSVLFPAGTSIETPRIVKFTICRSAFNAGVYGLRHAFGTGGAMTPTESAALINAIGESATTLIDKMAPGAAPNQRLFSATADYQVVRPAPIKVSMRLSAAEVAERNKAATAAYLSAVNGKAARKAKAGA